MHSFRGDSPVQKSGVFGHEGHPVGGTMIQPKRASMLRPCLPWKASLIHFWGASFPRKKCFNLENVFTVGGWGPVDFHKNGPPYGNHMQDQLSKLWISTSHSSQLDCFQMKPPKSLRWHPAKWKSPSWSTSIANPNMSEWWPHSKARARPRDHVWRLINALGCNSTNLMRFSSLCTSRSIPLRLLPKEQRPLDPPWPGATSQAQKRCRTSGWSGF